MSYTRGERIVTTVGFRVPASEPWGATYTEVLRAINEAVAEYGSLFAGIPTYHGTPSDDSIRVHAEDDAIVVSFVKKDLTRDMDSLSRMTRDLAPEAAVAMHGETGEGAR